MDTLSPGIPCGGNEELLSLENINFSRGYTEDAVLLFLLLNLQEGQSAVVLPMKAQHTHSLRPIWCEGKQKVYHNKR